MAKAIITKKKPINTKKIETDYKTVRINEILPFRVRFTAIGIEGISPGTVPPIPLQIIGFSNYIL